MAVVSHLASKALLIDGMDAVTEEHRQAESFAGLKRHTEDRTARGRLPHFDRKRKGQSFTIATVQVQRVELDCFRSTTGLVIEPKRVAGGIGALAL